MGDSLQIDQGLRGQFGITLRGAHQLTDQLTGEVASVAGKVTGERGV